MDMIKGFDLNNGPTSIHHLPFADDNILFSHYEVEKLANLFSLVKVFEKALGLNNNLHLSELMG